MSEAEMIETNTATGLPIAAKFQTMDDVIHALSQVERTFRDRHGIFVTPYVIITREIKRRIAADSFRDGAWIDRYAVTFANQYRAALWAYERHDDDAVPKCWRLSFELSAGGTGTVFKVTEAVCQHLEETVASFSYARALDAAWENGLTLCWASSEEERAALVHEIDAKAAVLAQRILRGGHAAPAAPVAVLRHGEGAFAGRWSGWVRERGRG